MKALEVPTKKRPHGMRGLRRYYLYLRRANLKRVVLALSTVFLVLLLAVLLCVLFVQDVIDSGRIFEGITIDGRPVGGLTPAEAETVVRDDVAGPIDRPMVLYYEGEEFSLDPAAIHLSVDTRAMVATAYLEGLDHNIFDRMFRRLLHMPIGVDVPVMVDYNQDELDAFVADIAGSLDYPPTSAAIKISSGRPEIVPSRNGLTVKQSETTAEIEKALPTPERRLPVVTESVSPEVTEEDVEFVVLISLSEHTLYLYDREELYNSYIIATGTEEYPTPTGRFHVTYKEEDPVWLPTSEWAKDKRGIPQPPGPDNPLGKYWIDIGGGIGIHATPFEDSLGEDASHGCIRMATWAAEEVYERVDVGTPVFIIE